MTPIDYIAVVFFGLLAMAVLRLLLALLLAWWSDREAGRWFK